MLNQVVVLNDVEEVKKALESLISEGLGQPMQLEVRLDPASSLNVEVFEQANMSGHSSVCIPVNGSENEYVWRIVSVYCFVSHAFQREEMLFLRFVARSLGLAIQRVQRMEELRKSLEMNSCVMAATIASVRSPDNTYKAVTEGIMTVLRVESAELLIWSEAFQAYRSVHRMGSLACAVRQTAFSLKNFAR